MHTMSAVFKVTTVFERQPKYYIIVSIVISLMMLALKLLMLRVCTVSNQSWGVMAPLSYYLGYMFYIPLI